VARRCTHCRSENRPEARFCRSCGKPLGAAGSASAGSPARACADCGQKNLPSARFCRTCGAALDAASASVPPLDATTTIAGPVAALNDETVSSSDRTPEGRAPTGRPMVRRAWVAVLLVASAYGFWWWYANTWTPESQHTAASTATPHTAQSRAPPQNAVTPPRAAAPEQEETRRDQAAGSRIVVEEPKTPAQPQPGQGAAHQPDPRNAVYSPRETPSALEAESARAPIEAARGGSTRGNAEHKQSQTSLTEPASTPRKIAAPGKPLYAQRRLVKEICAERSNVFSRSLCEVHECMRSVNADDPFCRESREIAERHQVGAD
jgi:hypothetical protein